MRSPAFCLTLLASSLAAQSGKNVEVTWSASATPNVSYNVYRANGPCARRGSKILSFTKITATPITALTYTDVNAPKGTLCYYATSYLATEASESEPSNQGEATTQPAPPTDLALAPLAENVEVTWSASATPNVSYNVYRGNDSCSEANLAYTKITVTPITALTYTDANAPNGTLCYYATSYLDIYPVSGPAESMPSNKAEAITQSTNLIVAPLAVTVYTGTQQQFTAMQGGNQVSNGVRWSLSRPEGEIDNSGLYTAPATIQGNNIQVQVLAEYQNQNATAQITLRKKNTRRAPGIPH
jgi:hypothetical protein